MSSRGPGLDEAAANVRASLDLLIGCVDRLVEQHEASLAVSPATAPNIDDGWVAKESSNGMPDGINPRFSLPRRNTLGSSSVSCLWPNWQEQWVNVRAAAEDGECGLPPSPRPSLARSSVLHSRNLVGQMRSTTEQNLDQTEYQGLDRVLARFVLNPGSRRRLIWDIIGTLVIFYDLITIPLQVFGPKPTTFMQAMAFFSATFWSMDIPLSFLSGFNIGSRLEMRPSQTAIHYISSWLLFDVAVVSIDWFVLINNFVSQGLEVPNASYMRLGKAGRMLRIMRLLRLFKVSGMLSDIVNHVRSEAFQIALGIFSLIVLIFIANHALACGWWLVGSLETGLPDSWIIKFQMQNRSLSYQYTTSLHWSLTQFTPASMEIHPTNAVERAYTVCTLLLAMITFSSFVSSLTNAMTQLRKLNSDRYAQLVAARRYLRENNVSLPISLRILCWIQSNITKFKGRTHLEDMVCLETLLRHFRVKLEQAVHAPVLTKHPFFFQLDMTYPLCLPRLYACLREGSLAYGMELFNKGYAASKMYFITSGELVYQGMLDDVHDCLSQPKNTTSFRKLMNSMNLKDCAPPAASRLQWNCSKSSVMGDAEVEGVTVVKRGAWLCEAALWVKYVHGGAAVSQDPA